MVIFCLYAYVLVVVGCNPKNYNSYETPARPANDDLLSLFLLSISLPVHLRSSLPIHLFLVNFSPPLSPLPRSLSRMRLPPTSAAPFAFSLIHPHKLRFLHLSIALPLLVSTPPSISSLSLTARRHVHIMLRRILLHESPYLAWNGGGLSEQSLFERWPRRCAMAWSLHQRRGKDEYIKIHPKKGEKKETMKFNQTNMTCVALPPTPHRSIISFF